MPTPRGRTATRVQPNSRAIVREAEWMVMPERIASELRPLVKLAKDQGWSIDGSGNGKLVWRGPNGEGPVYTGYRCQGRDLQNYRAELIRNGLKLDEKTAKEHVSDENYQELLAQGEAATEDQVMDALGLVSSAVATLCAKATMVDESRTAVEEWRQIAEDAAEEARKYKLEAQQDQALIGAIRETFNLAPWAILPEIAKLLGIDANGPSIRLSERTST